MVYTVDMVYTVATVETASHCLNTSMYAYCIYILFKKVRMLLEADNESLSKQLDEWSGAECSGYLFDCYEY